MPRGMSVDGSIFNAYGLSAWLKDVPSITEADHGFWVLVGERQIGRKVIRHGFSEREKTYETTGPWQTFADAVSCAKNHGVAEDAQWARVSPARIGNWVPVGTPMPDGFKLGAPGRPCETTVYTGDGRMSSWRTCGRPIEPGTTGCKMHNTTQRKSAEREEQRKAAWAADRERWDREKQARTAAEETRKQILALLEDEFAQLDKLLTVSSDGNLKITPEILLTLAQTHDAFRRL
jgi:hypothetical protein